MSNKRSRKFLVTGQDSQVFLDTLISIECRYLKIGFKEYRGDKFIFGFIYFDEAQSENKFKTRFSHVPDLTIISLKNENINNIFYKMEKIFEFGENLHQGVHQEIHH
jgi:hypothetical protein